MRRAVVLGGKEAVANSSMVRPKSKGMDQDSGACIFNHGVLQQVKGQHRYHQVAQP